MVRRTVMESKRDYKKKKPWREFIQEEIVKQRYQGPENGSTSEVH